MELLRQSGETLAGRVAFCEMQPLTVRETATRDSGDLWHRGGFPESLLAADDASSFEWRFDFIRTYLERDMPALCPRIPSETLRRFWTMLTHSQGQSFNASRLAGSLGLTGATVGRYLDLMVDLLLVRRLVSWRSNVGRRLIKAPKTYLRGSGICHALLGIGTFDTLIGHPVAGGSWEGFVIENIMSGLPASRAAFAAPARTSSQHAGSSSMVATRATRCAAVSRRSAWRTCAGRWGGGGWCSPPWGDSPLTSSGVSLL